MTSHGALSFTVLLLNNRTLRFYDFEELRHNHKIEVIPVVSRPHYETLPSAFRETLKKIHIIDGSGPDAGPLTTFPMDQVEAFFLEERKAFPDLRVVASDEMNSLTAALLREKYRLPGTSSNVIQRYRNKLFQKEILKQRGVRVPRFASLSLEHHVCEASTLYEDFQGRLHASFVIKPTDSTCTIGVEVIHSVLELDAYLEKYASFKDFIVEEFLEGKLYHVDMIITKGAYSFTEVSEYFWNGLTFVKGKNHGSVLLHKQDLLRARILSFCKKANAHLGMHSGCVHMEVFVTPQEDIVFLEAGPRPAGSLVPLVLTRTFGTNFMNAALLAELGLPAIPFKEPITYGFWTLFPRRQGTVKELITPCLKSPYHLEWFVKEGERFDSATSIVDKSGHLTAFNTNYADLYQDFEALRHFQAVASF